MESCGETPGTNARNGQVQLEHQWTLKNEKEDFERHKVFFSGKKKDKREHGAGFLVHKDIVNTVMGCCPVSSRRITIRLRVIPFNITVDYDDNEMEEFYDQLQNVDDQTSKKDILVQGDWKAKVGNDACENR